MDWTEELLVECWAGRDMHMRGRGIKLEEYRKRMRQGHTNKTVHSGDKISTDRYTYRKTSMTENQRDQRTTRDI